MIESEKHELIERAQCALWKCNFWRSLFYESMNRHSIWNEYYLVGNDIPRIKVDVYLFKLFKKLQEKYKIPFKRQTGRLYIEYSLALSAASSSSKRNGFDYKSEMLVRLDNRKITVMLLPYSSLNEIFLLDEYLIVEKVIVDFCESLFNSPDEHFTEFLKYRSKIEEGARSLTPKTIEIAQTSIESIFLKSPVIIDYPVINLLYSTLMIDGKEETIFHKDFLDNPQILISKLQKK